MSVPLLYEISVNGEDKIKRVFKSIESEAKATASRVDSSRRSVAARITRDPVAKQTARGFDQIGRAARAADAAAIRERMSGDKRASAARLRQIAQEERAGVRAAEKSAAASSRAASRVASGAARTVGGSVSKVVGFGANALALGGGLLGGMAAGNAIESTIALQHAQRGIIRNARGPGQEGLYTQAHLCKKVETAALGSGASQEGITEGLSQFVAKTGNLKTAVDNIDVFTQAAMAAGADVKDVFSGAADLSNQMHIESITDMQQAFADLIFQGKKGAFEIKNLASELPELAATAARMGMSGVGGIHQLGGLMQLSMKGTGSGPEASTAFQNAMNQLVNKAADLQSGAAFGGRKVNVFEHGDPRQKMLDMPTVIANMLEASRGNLTEISNVLEIRGNKAFSPETTAFRDAYQSTKGTDAEKAKAGRDAVVKMLTDAMDTGAKWSDVQEDAANALKDTSAQLENVKTQFTNAVGQQLLPVLTDLIPKFTELVPTIANLTGVVGSFAQEVINNPIPNIGKIIAAKVGLDLAGAGLAAVFKSALETAVKSSGLGAMAGLGGVASVFVTGGLVGVSIGAAVGTAASARLGAGSAAAAQTEAELAESKLSVFKGEGPGKLGEEGAIRGRKNALEKMRDELAKNGPTALETTAGAASSVLGGKSASEVQKASIADLQKMIDKLSAALATGADKIASAEPGGAKPNRNLPIGAR
jgi:hypothetical protein